MGLRAWLLAGLLLAAGPGPAFAQGGVPVLLPGASAVLGPLAPASGIPGLGGPLFGPRAASATAAASTAGGRTAPPVPAPAPRTPDRGDGTLRPVPPLTDRVIDQTGTLSATQQRALAAKLERIETERGAQVVVLIVPSTLPEDVAAYAQRVGDAWKIGRREVGDGLLVVVAKDDRRIHIATARTLEGAIPDVLAGRIIRDTVTPAFRAGDYAGGLNAAVDQLGRAIAGENLPAPDAKRDGRGGKGGFAFGDLAIFLMVAVPILGTVLRAMFGRAASSVLTAGAVGGLAWWVTASILMGVLGGIVALVIVATMSLGGGRRGGLGPIIWSGGGGGGGGWSGGGGFGGGGGFSSGGGGSFGGGGASGSW